jgi:RND family efflux transporter MFP subunit
LFLLHTRYCSGEPALIPNLWILPIRRAGIMRALSRGGAGVLACGIFVFAQTVQTVEVVSDKIERTVRLPGEFLPYQSVDLHARVTGFVDSVKVDRGSVVRKGDLLVTLSAPEMKAELLEAEAKVKALEAQQLEAEAKVVAEQSTYERLKTASGTPGAIAGNELIQAEKSVEAAKAAQQGVQMSVRAAQASLNAMKELESYLELRAPFDGTITDRYVHPGALVGPAAGGTSPLVRLEQISQLRLVVAVPETEVGGIVRRARVSFTVPAYPATVFHGVVARVGGSVDPKTRTMPVELDVANPAGRLSPGMYPEVQWPVRMSRSSLLVPPSSIVTTTARSFVIRVNNGRAEWVDVRRGRTAGDLVEVYGNLKPGDRIVRQANDEIRDGSRVAASSEG